MEYFEEAGELPQLEQHGATSTRSTKNESTSDSDNQSPFYVTVRSNSLIKSGAFVRGIDLKINTKLITDNVYISIPIYVTSAWAYYQPDLTVK
jgi:hypothetical protein